METGSVERQPEFEDAMLSSVPEESSTGTVVTMVACQVALLLMLAACSPPSHAQAHEPHARDVNTSAPGVVIRLETLTVLPSPEDRSLPAKNRWQRFEEALNASGSRGYRVVESRTNSGIRTACYEPCVMDCCVSSGGFSLAGHRVGR